MDAFLDLLCQRPEMAAALFDDATQTNTDTNIDDLDLGLGIDLGDLGLDLDIGIDLGNLGDLGGLDLGLTVCAKRGRAPKQAVPEECKDAKYLARRLKNTAAAAANRAFHREAKRREKARLAALTATRRDLLAELATLRAQWPALCAAVRHHVQI